MASCPDCGTALSGEPWAPGLCPHCSLLLALDQGTEELEAPTLDYPSATLAEGQVLGNRYRIRALLGRGGMGEVWRALDLKLRVEVALKALRRELFRDERAVESLRQEVRMAREVISPNVCRVYDLVELDGQELVSMEFIDGITLLDVLKMRAPLDLTEAHEIASQFLAGLEAIQDAGLVHRDVKPENLMITRAGRVVLMDFGIAKGLADGESSTVVGTPAYMAPEQSRGEASDARADVFSAGVVLAEMIAPSGLGSFEARKEVWKAIHEEPPQLPDSAWAPLIRKAVARMPEQRFPGAAALARALEEVTLRVDLAEDLRPYPGLASFGESDSEYFFGRELEVEEMWKKLRRPQIYGLIGPSGAGKSSFLRAGLLGVTPTGWQALVTAPGSRPVANLARALVPEMSGDTEALQLLVHAHDSDSLLEVMRRWRRHHDQVLVVFDQFEELFTLNPPEQQESFADLVSRLALEADAHVLLSMRDDFLFHCSNQPALAPLFSELTPLRAPAGTALRRALVQPALKCGYRFEDDSLVDQMVEEVEQERGALPMLAFAAARLWEHRDREQGLLTREAYEHIGGVGGALAQHAEHTLERIGQDHIPIVRELFRNLVTAEGTRAARDREQLLSVFSEGAPVVAAAEEVLDALIDARLLTAYEVSGSDEVDKPQQSVEIIHESLLANWPRLVRWQTQDQESALLRDQLRQAAQMWEERGRPEDLLWTGTSYGEFELWRGRYAGGLSTAEQQFADAMKSHAERRKRRRRMFVAAVIILLAVGLGIVGIFWRQAVAAQKRAEANQLLALGRVELEINPTGALAFAVASLERADEPVTRRFALEVLSQGPVARHLELLTPGISEIGVLDVDFSPDGKWLASSYDGGELKLWSSTGAEPKLLANSGEDLPSLGFSPDSTFLAARSHPSHRVQIWSIPDGRLARTLPTQGPVDFRLARRPPRIITFTRHGDQTRVEAWPPDAGDSEILGDLDARLYEWGRWLGPWKLDIDFTGTRLAHLHRDSGEPWQPGGLLEVRLVGLGEAIGAPAQRLGPHPNALSGVRFYPDGKRLVAADVEGEVHLWDLERSDEAPWQVLRHLPGWTWGLRFDAAGSRLAAVSGHAAVWDLEGPPQADPLLIPYGDSDLIGNAALGPEGRWLATAAYQGVSVWPIDRRYPAVLRGHEKQILRVAFLPDGNALVSTAQDSTLRLWPLSAAQAGSNRILFEAENSWFNHLAVGPAGSQILVSAGGSKRSIWLVPVDGEPPRELARSKHEVHSLSLGHRTAVYCERTEERDWIRVWDLETNGSRKLEPGDGVEIWAVQVVPDSRLITSGSDGIRIWNIEEGNSEVLSERPGVIAVSSDGQLVLVGRQGENDEAVLYDLEQGTHRQLDSHGPAGWVALDTNGGIALTTGDTIRIGPVTGETPHLILGPEDLRFPVISPDGRWITGLDNSDTITLWPVPDLSRRPLHSLPYDELLAKLRTITNLRVVSDPESSTGWGWDLDPFPGWEEVPEW